MLAGLGSPGPKTKVFDSWPRKQREHHISVRFPDPLSREGYVHYLHTQNLCCSGGISSWENPNLLWWGRRKQPNLCSRSLATKAVFHANSLENTKNRGGPVLPRCTEVTPRNCLRAVWPGESSRGSDGGLCGRIFRSRLLLLKGVCAPDPAVSCFGTSSNSKVSYFST